jgi:O-antigen/teichoic acid export membrane protein
VKLLSNYLSLSVGEGISKVLTFAAFAYIARVLGPTSFGYVEFAGAALMCANLIVDQGFSAYGAREIAKTPEQTKTIVGEVVAVRILLAGLGYLAVVLFALAVAKGWTVTLLLLVYGLSLLALPLFLQWVFQGHDQMHLVAITQVIRQLVFATTVFLFLRTPQDLLVVGLAEVAATAIVAAVCWWLYQKKFGMLKLRLPQMSGRLFREGVPIGLSQMFWVIRMFGGTIAIGLIASASDTGFFAGAQRILLAMHTFVWLYFFNLLPSMSRAWEKGENEFNRLIQRSIEGVLWIGSAILLAWVLLAQVAMRLVYGAEFAASGTVLAMFGFVWAIAWIDGNYRYALIAAGKQGAELATSAIGAVVALVLIPFGYFKGGLNGAALGLVIAELVIWLSAGLCARRLLAIRISRSLVVPLAAGILAFGLFSWLPFASNNLRFAVALLFLIGIWLVSYRGSRTLTKEFNAITSV